MSRSQSLVASQVPPRPAGERTSFRVRLKPHLATFVPWILTACVAVAFSAVKKSIRIESEARERQTRMLASLVDDLGRGRPLSDEEVERSLVLVGLRDRGLRWEQEAAVAETWSDMAIRIRREKKANEDMAEGELAEYVAQGAFFPESTSSVPTRVSHTPSMMPTMTSAPAIVAPVPPEQRAAWAKSNFL